MWDVEQGPFTTRNTQTQLRRLTAKATSSTEANRDGLGLRFEGTDALVLMQYGNLRLVFSRYPLC